MSPRNSNGVRIPGALFRPVANERADAHFVRIGGKHARKGNFFVFVDFGSPDFAPDDDGLIKHVHDVAREFLSAIGPIKFVVNARRDPSKLVHPIPRDFFVNLAGQLRRRRKGFVVILEKSHAFEPVGLDESNQISKLGLPFSRKTDDETRADKRARKLGSDSRKHRIDVFAIVKPTHFF